MTAESALLAYFNQYAKILEVLKIAWQTYSLLGKLNEAKGRIDKECGNKRGLSKFKCIATKLPII